jgi:hypothetical protein
MGYRFFVFDIFMICSEEDLENKTKRQREPNNINDEDNINDENEECKEQEIIEAENLKKKKLDTNEFEVIEDNQELRVTIRK